MKRRNDKAGISEKQTHSYYFEIETLVMQTNQDRHFNNSEKEATNV